MKIAIASIGWTILLAAQDAGRVPIPPAPPPVIGHAQAAIAGIRQAAESLKAWRAAAETGADVDMDELKQVYRELELMVTELKPLQGRAQAQAKGRAPAQPERAATSPTDEQISGDAREIARAWIDDARALGEGASERREKALLAVRNALQGGDATANLAALQTLTAIGDVEYDKASFRPLILPFAHRARGSSLQSALYALLNTEHQPGDLDLVHAAWQRDPDALRDSMLHLMASFGGGRLEGRSEEIALELLAGRDRNTNQQFSGMWGARVGPRLEARVLEFARGTDGELRHAAIYFGLSTFENKSKAVVDALIATLADPDHNNSGRALWGLGHGVPVELQRDVAAALVDLHNGRSDPQTRESCVRIVKQYGGPEYEAKLKH